MNEIALLYGEEEKQNALDTFEDFLNELTALKLDFKKLKNNKLQCKNINFTFANIENENEFLSKSQFFNKIYTSERLRSMYEFQITTICEKVIFHPYPFQSLVDMILDVKNEKAYA